MPKHLHIKIAIIASTKSIRSSMCWESYRMRFVKTCVK
jgi:hypothetical protein